MPSIKYGLTSKRRWKCRCECGKETEVDTGGLTSGKTKSCGCLHSETSAENGIKSRHLVAKTQAAFNSIKSIYKSNAKKRNLVWGLSDEYALSLLNGNCYFCGDPPSNLYKTTYYNQKYNGIDRLNNDMGYAEENTVSCCKVCNHAKHTMDKDTFLNWVKKVNDHQRTMEELDGTR